MGNSFKVLQCIYKTKYCIQFDYCNFSKLCKYYCLTITSDDKVLQIN